MLRLRKTRRRAACIGAMLVYLWGISAASAEPFRVLVLNPFGRDVEPFSAAVSSFRSTLVREIGVPVDLHEIPLDLARFNSQEGEAPLVAFLEDRIKNHPVDLVVPIGGAGVQFVGRYREQLFPLTPVLAVAAEPRMIAPEFLQENATLVSQEIDLPGMVEDILRMRPETDHIAVVFGASQLEDFWVAECRRKFQAFEDRIRFTWLNDLPLEQVVGRCADLPPNSFIFHGLFLVDGAGIPSEKNEALRRLHQSASAPIFSIFESEFGLGSIGGRLFQNAGIGEKGARAAIRILRGEKPGNIPPVVLDAAAAVYDARELKRWGVKESRLPAGSRIAFREPGFFERYRWQVIGVGLFGLLQALLIVGLLVNRTKRRRAEAEAALLADISSKFVNLPPDKVDDEIMDAQRRLCELLDIDFSVLWQWSDRNAGSFMATHAFSLEHGSLPPSQLKDDDFPWVRQQVLAGQIVSHRSLDEMPEEANRDRESARELGIKSHLTLPLAVGGEKPLGIFGLNTTRAERSWPESLIKRMQLVSQIFANALARKRADESRRESELRLSLAIDSAEAGLWVLDWESQTFIASAKARVMFGYSPEDPITMEKFEASVHAQDRELVLGSIRSAAESGDPVDIEYRIRLGDGRERWIVSRGRPFFSSTGETERLLGLSMDITEEKQSVEALRSSEELNRVTFEQAAIGIAHVAPDGRWLRVNDRLCDILGYTREELVGMNIRDISAQEDLEEQLELDREILSGEIGSYSLEKRYVREDGTQVWANLNVSLLRNVTGEPVHFIVVLEDITEQRRAETEAHELRGSLAHAGRVTLLGQLASALAHELSQPLGAILRNAEAAEIMLKDSSPDLEELRAIIDDILADDERAGQVITRLRSLLKRRSVDAQPIPVSEVIDEVLAIVHTDAAARQVKITSDYAPDLPSVRGDRIHLQQVVLNLLVNAMDAMDECPPEQRSIDVEVKRGDEGFVEIQISDSGPGIPADSLEQLFEPFFTSKASGMGVGLPVSKTIIEAHQGKLWAGNSPAGGACFHFTVPVAN